MVSASFLARVSFGKASNNATPNWSGWVGVRTCQNSCDLNHGRKVLPGSLPSQPGHSFLPSRWFNTEATFLQPPAAVCCSAKRVATFFLVSSSKLLAATPVMLLLASLAPLPTKGPVSAPPGVPSPEAEVEKVGGCCCGCGGVCAVVGGCCCVEPVAPEDHPRRLLK